ncbi:hypothetical protein [Vreelandella boliviensis]|uniref:hypothetical protein n=1 Tax=Vreelandella boliviensis TaxID=223527 RepID=UPI001B8AFE3E|nr:hypothetical protein [Halomonas boliviensis]MBS3668044.1 hypothetical protein [Halomonas boliviensis]
MLHQFVLEYSHYPYMRPGFAGAFCYEALRVPPLLPEFLSPPVQIVVQSLPPAESWPIWASAAATLIGSFGGALIGGLVAYRGALKANSRLVRQSKLEECLTLIDDMESVHVSNLKMLSNVLRRGGTLENAQSLINVFEHSNNVEVAKKIKSIAKLHAPEVSDYADKLLTQALFANQLFQDISLRRWVGSQDSVNNLRDHSFELSKKISLLCSEIEKKIIHKAKT